MIFLTLKMSLKSGMKQRLGIILTINLISNRDRLSIQFLKLRKKYSKKFKVIGIEKINSKEIYSIIGSPKVDIQTF